MLKSIGTLTLHFVRPLRPKHVMPISRWFLDRNWSIPGMRMCWFTTYVQGSWYVYTNIYSVYTEIKMGWKPKVSRGSNLGRLKSQNYRPWDVDMQVLSGNRDVYNDIQCDTIPRYTAIGAQTPNFSSPFKLRAWNGPRALFFSFLYFI